MARRTARNANVSQGPHPVEPAVMCDHLTPSTDSNAFPQVADSFVGGRSRNAGLTGDTRRRITNDTQGVGLNPARLSADSQANRWLVCGCGSLRPARRS